MRVLFEKRNVFDGVFGFGNGDGGAGGRVHETVRIMMYKNN